MRIQSTPYTYLYFLLLALTMAIMILALGPGLYGAQAGWQYLFFDQLCHQDPLRSFSLNGAQMAVCSRCLGIYVFFAFGVLIIPAVDYFSKQSTKVMVRLFLTVVFLNVIDVLGNISGIWSNTLNSRFLLGALAGLSAALILTNTFFSKTKSEVQDG